MGRRALLVRLATRESLGAATIRWKKEIGHLETRGNQMPGDSPGIFFA